MTTLAERAKAAGGKIWAKEGKELRVYLTNEAIEKMFGFKKTEHAKYLNEFKDIKKAKVYVNIADDTLHASEGYIRVIFNSNNIKCFA